PWRSPSGPRSRWTTRCSRPPPARCCWRSPSRARIEAMSNLSLYLASVLIWGSTWLAITFQYGKVAPEVSVAYRFALAAAILMGWCLARRMRMRFAPAQHGWIALQGALMFGANYVLVYLAEQRIPSGLMAVIF